MRATDTDKLWTKGYVSGSFDLYHIGRRPRFFPYTVEQSTTQLQALPLLPEALTEFKDYDRIVIASKKYYGEIASRLRVLGISAERIV